MTIRFEIKKDFALQKKFTVNGQDYDSLDQVPAELRAAIEKELEAGAPPTATITINGRTYGMQDVPAPLRAFVGQLASLALKQGQAATSPRPPVHELRLEPLLPMKFVVLVIGLAALLFWLARSVF